MHREKNRGALAATDAMVGPVSSFGRLQTIPFACSRRPPTRRSPRTGPRTGRGVARRRTPTPSNALAERLRRLAPPSRSAAGVRPSARRVHRARFASSRSPIGVAAVTATREDADAYAAGGPRASNGDSSPALRRGSRMRPMTTGSVIHATTDIGTWHLGHSSGSTSKTFLNTCRPSSGRKHDDRRFASADPASAGVTGSARGTGEGASPSPASPFPSAAPPAAFADAAFASRARPRKR